MTMLNAFFGPVSRTIRLTLAASYSYDGVIVGAGTAFANFKLDADGSIIVNTNDLSATVGDWIDPVNAAGAAWECRATILSGSLTSGSTGSWLALDTDREWGLTRGSIGMSSVSFTLEIGRAGTSTALATATVTLTATREP